MTKGQFSPNEWKLLLNAPGWVYVALIAAERGTVLTRRAEAKALDKFLSGYKTQSPLVKEIIAGQKEADDEVEGTSKEAETMLGQVGTLLERKVGEEEGDAVRDLLVQAGEAAAKATREALFGDSESAKETKALARIETALKATDADKQRRREAAAAAEAQRRAEQAREAEDRAAAERKREVAQAEAEKKAKVAAAKREATEAEAKRRAAEAEAKRRAAEAEKKAKEAAAKRKATEAEAKRRAAEAEAARIAAEAEAKRKAEEAEAKRKAEEAEAQKAAKAAAAAAEATRIYVVKPGDTLSGIAKEMYGKAGRWPEIFEANRDVIKKANLIRPGWKLRIPD